MPQLWAENSRLGRWVKDQRLYKKKLDRGEPSFGMTTARAAKLTALGLDWEPHRPDQPNDTGWEAELARLAAYKAAHGDCEVPVHRAEDEEVEELDELDPEEGEDVPMQSAVAAADTSAGAAPDTREPVPAEAIPAILLARPASTRAALLFCTVISCTYRDSPCKRE